MPRCAFHSGSFHFEGQKADTDFSPSLQVDLSCGTTNALLSVIEPEKCEYLFKVTTPAVCYPTREEVGGERPKDEL